MRFSPGFIQGFHKEDCLGFCKELLKGFTELQIGFWRKLWCQRYASLTSLFGVASSV